MPFALGLYHVTVAITAGIFVILTVGLNIITGYAGQPTLGHAAFWGIGAYAQALLVTRAGLSFWSAWPLAVLVTAAIGALIGSVSIRLREDFLAITTIGVNFVVVAVFLYTPYFGGSLGISGVLPPRLLGVPMGKPAYLVLVLAVIAALALLDRWLRRTWLGLGWQALRQDETAAEACGVDTRRFKVAAFVLGTAIAGLAGTLYAHFIQFVEYRDFGFPASVAILSMAALGGLGTLRGAVAGAVLLTVLPEVFRVVSNYRMFLYGVLLLLVMRYQPSGLLGAGSWLGGWLDARGRRRHAVAAPDVSAGSAPPAGHRAPAAPDQPESAAGSTRPPRPRSGGTPILEVRHLSRRFAGVQALRDVSFTVAEGEIFGLIGPNGAGKTTLFHVVTGVLAPHGGAVRFRGRPIHGRRPSQIARMGIGRTFQLTRPFADLSALDNVRVALGHRAYATWRGALARADTEALTRQALDLLARVGLGAVAGTPAGALPLGLQRRLEVARALALDPQLLLLDEPLGGLAAGEVAAITALLRDLRAEGRTIVLVEHNMPAAMALCDRLVVLHFGEKLAEGPPAAIRQDPAVQAAYLGTKTVRAGMEG